MKPFRISAARSPISLICMVLLILPVIGMVLAPAPASAQLGTMEVAVVDFRNVSKMPNAMFTTMTTDAVVVELLRSGKFSVVTADALQSKMEELGYKNKGERTSSIILTPSMMVRLGQEIGANGIISGDITSITVDTAKKKAVVHVVVRLLDVTSGEYINGAAATGESYPRIGYTPDKETDWIIEAINNASRKAVETMIQYIIPEATITGTVENNEVLLNKGSRDGLAVGMEMIVTRRGEAGAEEVVGRVKITSLSPTDARAKVLRSMRGAQPEDRVRAVYSPPDNGKDSTDQSERGGKTTKIAAGSKFLTTVALIAGLAILLKPGSGSAGISSSAVAAAFANPTDISSSFGDGGIVVLWNTPKFIRTQDIVEYHLWRDSTGVQVGLGDKVTGAVPVRVPQIGFPVNGPLGKFDNNTVDDPVSASIAFQFPSTSDPTSLSTGNATTQALTQGVSHNYWISCVYKKNPITANGVVSFAETTPTYAGRATMFAQRPAPVSPGSLTASEVVDLSNVTFQWQGSRSADSDVSYVIEVAPDQSFVRSATWVSGPIRFNTSQDGQLFTKTFTNILNTSPELKNIPADSTLYWRVGARATSDTPGPYPAGNGLNARNGGPKSTRYIYNDPSNGFSFLTLGGPPVNPGG